MDAKAKHVMHTCLKGSLDGAMPFPQVVGQLARIGCEQYHADFRRQEKTYYMADGESHCEPLPVGSEPIPETFAAADIAAALHAIQSRQIDYPQFLRRIMAAGCVGYLVYIAGRQTIYLGRRGDVYVEPFSSAAVAAVGQGPSSARAI